MIDRKLRANWSLESKVKENRSISILLFRERIKKLRYLLLRSSMMSDFSLRTNTFYRIANVKGLNGKERLLISKTVGVKKVNVKNR